MQTCIYVLSTIRVRFLCRTFGHACSVFPTFDYSNNRFRTFEDSTLEQLPQACPPGQQANKPTDHRHKASTPTGTSDKKPPRLVRQASKPTGQQAYGTSDKKQAYGGSLKPQESCNANNPNQFGSRRWHRSNQFINATQKSTNTRNIVHKASDRINSPMPQM